MILRILQAPLSENIRYRVSARLPSSGPGHHPWTTRGQQFERYESLCTFTMLVSGRRRLRRPISNGAERIFPKVTIYYYKRTIRWEKFSPPPPSYPIACVRSLWGKGGGSCYGNSPPHMNDFACSPLSHPPPAPSFCISFLIFLQNANIQTELRFIIFIGTNIYLFLIQNGVTSHGPSSVSNQIVILLMKIIFCYPNRIMMIQKKCLK